MTKSLIRSQSRRGTRSEKSPPAGLPRRTPPTTACHGCGGLFTRKTWRHDHPVGERLYDRVVWRVCPACRQTARGEGYGKVVIVDARAAEDAIRRRIANVAARARVTQPQRRLVDITTRRGGGLEVITSSQKLAHRVARELEKAFGGRATYDWDPGDGSLRAVWSAPVPRPEPGTRRAGTGRSS
jgi:NMD protein affecting ribosome stability and mRNA decay